MPEHTKHCPVCGDTFVVMVPKRGRPRKYDRRACRDVAHRQGTVEPYRRRVREDAIPPAPPPPPPLRVAASMPDTSAFRTSGDAA